jgi:hypothetical protein
LADLHHGGIGFSVFWLYFLSYFIDDDFLNMSELSSIGINRMMRLHVSRNASKSLRKRSGKVGQDTFECRFDRRSHQKIEWLEIGPRDSK